jgi:hypothetical protein
VLGAGPGVISTVAGLKGTLLLTEPRVPIIVQAPRLTFVTKSMASKRDIYAIFSRFFDALQMPAGVRNSPHKGPRPMLNSTCFICNEPLKLESCVVDETGNPTHQDCYLVKLGVVKKGSEKGEIVEFLNSLNTRSMPTICPACGATLEQQTAKFFWAGKSWEVPLMNCPKCNPVRHEI